ncbi:unnamed protein product [Meganyctiphanes norvegica]|uniref:Chitin-binding type-2 domain-containing protein n=1 Tax=Meganyctiphanes norvegica TaxID=48144 RepID=A0AAV2PSB1_MEGNR
MKTVAALVFVASLCTGQQFFPAQSPAVRLAGTRFFQGANQGPTFRSNVQEEQSGRFFQGANRDFNQANQVQVFSEQDRLNNFRIQQNRDNAFQFERQNPNFSFQQPQVRIGAEPSFDGSLEVGSFEPLNLPSGASALLGGISSSFSCADRPYGYYADPDNYCRVFHICNPALFGDGTVQTYQYSFFCGEGAVFDQSKLTCVAEFEATPCQDAPNFYFRNEVFGRNVEA